MPGRSSADAALAAQGGARDPRSGRALASPTTTHRSSSSACQSCIRLISAIPIRTWTRQSGFLTPSYSSSTALGAEVTIPYYWSLAPDRDVTFLPRFTSEESVVLAGEYRERTRNGRYTVDGSITRALTADDGRRPNSGTRFRPWPLRHRRELAMGLRSGTGFRRHLSAPLRTSRRKTIWSRLCLRSSSSQRSYMSGAGYIVPGSSDQTIRGTKARLSCPLLDAHLVSAPDYAGGYTTARRQSPGPGAPGRNRHAEALGRRWLAPADDIAGRSPLSYRREPARRPLPRLRRRWNALGALTVTDEERNGRAVRSRACRRVALSADHAASAPSDN